MFGITAETLPIYLMRIPVILIALTVHESAHGWMASKMGDQTARNFGRITLNPLKHLDPIGAICMLILGFGWAKPVPVNARNFDNPRKGMALTALAGPVSNILLSFIGVLLYSLFAALFNALGVYNTAASIWLTFLRVFFTLNIYLAVFNMIPIPPFDGSRVLFVFLPDRWYFGIMKYERIIMFAMLALMYTGLLSKPLSFIASNLINGMFWLVGLIPGL